MKKQIAAAVLLLVALGTVASFGAYQAGVFDNDPVQAQAADPKPGADKEEKKEEAAPPKGEKTDDGLEYKIPFERGEGSVKFARQNEMLRVDYDVRLPYSAGDGQGARGSSIDPCGARSSVNRQPCSMRARPARASTARRAARA